VATATLLEARTGHTLEPVEKALLCQRAEHEFAGVPCGIMDQFTSALAEENHLLLLDCRSREVQLVPMTDPAVAVLIINTNVRHELSGGEYAKRRSECEAAARGLGVIALRDATLNALTAAQDRLNETVFRRARHVITEIARTLATAEALAASNWDEVGQFMYASHASLRDDYEVSCAELDAVVEIAQALGPERGVIGCRMTGGGFGGCAVALVQANAVAAISQEMEKYYREQTGREPTLFVSRPAAGAHVIE
jgi:galactokinase